MRWVFLLAVVSLSGCLETEPPKPHPAMAKLQAACDGGDTDACGQVLAAEQRNAAIRQQAAANIAATMQRNNQAAMQANTDLFARTMQRPQTTQCMPAPYGGMNCTSY